MELEKLSEQIENHQDHLELIEQNLSDNLAIIRE